MERPVVGNETHAQFSLEDYLRSVVEWSKANDPRMRWSAQVGAEIWKVRVNDFPEENLYTLFVNDEAVGDFDEWPRRWLRIQEDH